MKKHLYYTLLLYLFLGMTDSAIAQTDRTFNSFGGTYKAVPNSSSANPESTTYKITQNGSTISGSIVSTNPDRNGTISGTISSGVVTGTISWTAGETGTENFNLLKDQRQELPTFRYYKGKSNRAYLIHSLAAHSNIPTVAMGSKKTNTVVNAFAKKPARKIEGYYRIKGMSDANGVARDFYVELQDHPDLQDNSKAYPTAYIVGKRHGVGSSDGRLFKGETDEDNITIIFDVIYEQNQRNDRANGRIGWTNSGMTLVAPKMGYRMEKVTKVVAVREGNR